MASGRIKGITIEFDGKTDKLGKALKDIDSKTKDLNKELRQVDNALKFNPTNVDLWRQKQQLLNEKVSETDRRLSRLRDAQKALDAKGVDKSSEQYRELQREIITTNSKLKTFKNQLKEVGNANLKALSKQIENVGNKLETAGQSMAGLSAAAAGVVGTLGVISYKAGESADDLNTLSRITGIGTESLQKYSYAADLVDVSTETIAKSNQRLKRSAYAAANGSDAQAEAFEKIGVSVTDANGNLRDSEDIFQDVLKGLGEMTNETERDAVAQKILGKSASELNPLIEDGGETYKMVADTLAKYDLDYIDQETLDKANEFNDQLDMMKLLGSVALAQVGSQLAAYLAPALEKVVDLVGRFANWLSSLDPRVLAIIGAIAGVVAVIAPLLIGLGKLAFAVSSIINLVNVVGPAIGGLAAAGGPILLVIAAIAALVAAGVWLYKHWDTVKKYAAALGKKITEVWNAIKSKVIGAVNTIRTKVTGAWNTIKNATSSAWESVKDAIVRPFTWAKEKIESIIDKIKSWFPITLGDIFGGIKLPHFDVEWSSVTAFGKTIDFPSGFDIDWYKNGGIFNSPSLIGVGEAGSEAVVPLDKFWDKLDSLTASQPVINIYPAPNQSPREIAKEVERILVQDLKQRNKAYGNI